MKTKNVLINDFSVIIERDSAGYYIASVPAFHEVMDSQKGCHTQAKSLDKLMSRIQEAIELCLEVQCDKIEPLCSTKMQS